MTNHSRSRGQSLVLFAMTLMLLTLMVMMTIGFGVKAKEKMELQQITDAAAYSNAVSTARTLNGIAILNRAEVSVMVTLAATQANISYATQYLSTLGAIYDWMSAGRIAGMAATCALTGLCCTAAATLPGMKTQVANRYQTVYNQYFSAASKLDDQAGLQGRAIQGAATAVWYRQRTVYQSNFDNFITDQKIAKKIVNQAKVGQRWDEFKVDDAAGAVSQREIQWADGAPTAGAVGADANKYALSPRNVSRELGVKAAMGTRGAGFVRDRGSGIIISSKIMLDLGWTPPGNAILLSNSGGAAWGDDLDKHPPPGPAPYASNADDEGSITGTLGNDITCPASALLGVGTDVELVTSDLPDTDDIHNWHDILGMAEADVQKHTMGDCTACPGVWVMFIDLNPSIIGSGPGSPKVKQYLWGQPKNFAVIRRDYNARCGDATYSGNCGADPWNLMFKFRFTPGGEDFDNRGLQLTTGANISNQMALASGITYYHRPGHWKEPPNFFNPFWRGTLASVMVDSEGDPASGTDVVDTLQATSSPSKATAKSMVNKLQAQGYKGW